MYVQGVSQLSNVKAWEWNSMIQNMPLVLYELGNNVALTPVENETVTKILKALVAVLTWAQTARQFPFPVVDLSKLWLDACRYLHCYFLPRCFRARI